MDAERLRAAIEFHGAHETRWRRDFLTERGRYIGVADEPETPEDVLGPVRPRGGPNGLVDPEHDLVVVVRWIDKAAAGPFLRLILHSINT